MNQQRILIVDDEEPMRRLIATNLKASGYRIRTAADGNEALQLLDEHQFDLLLLDINMPRLDGVEVLRHLRQDPRTAQLPVIMLTTTDDPREVKRCYELGCGCYVTKPVEYDRFVEAIRRLGLFLSIVQIPREDAKS